MRNLRTLCTVLALSAAAFTTTTAAPALAEDPAFLSFGVGAYDWNRQIGRAHV